MSNKSKNNKKYSVSDIERYNTRKMQPHEMHEIEKAALEDSFLADAIEGFVHTPSPEADITDLKTKLHSRENRPKVIAIGSYGKLFRVAAMFLLLLGLGWLTYEFTFKKPATDISLNRQQEIINEQTETAVTSTATDSFKKEQATQVQSGAPKLSSDDIIKPKSNPGIAGNQNSEANRNRAFKKLANKVPNTEGSDPEQSLDNEAKILNETGITTEEPLSHFNKPADTFSLQKNNVAKKFEENDSNLVVMGYGQKRIAARQRVAKDPPRQLNASIPGVEVDHNKKVEISNTGKQVIITINKADDGVNEIVLTKPRKDSVYKKRTSVIVEEAEPEESWSKFGEYISDNLRTPEDLDFDSIKGTVKVSFEVNASGEAVNIHVEKSLCAQCDAEALRLIKEAPKWKRKAKRGKVSITF